MCYMTQAEYSSLNRHYPVSIPTNVDSSPSKSQDVYHYSEDDLTPSMKNQDYHPHSLKPTKRPNHSKYAKALLLKWLAVPSHFFNPYPCAATKRGLAQETNLREDQIANWFVNTRKRFLTPIIAEIQKKYGNSRIDSIKSKMDLYNLLKDISREGNDANFSVQWITSFLGDANCCWFDDK